MILILTESDQTKPVPITPEIIAKNNLPPESVGKTVTELSQKAKQASQFAETVWYRDSDGKVMMLKSAKGLPQGTPVTLFAVAELFGIRVSRDAEVTDSAELILKDIVAAIEPSQELPAFWKSVLDRAKLVLNPSKS